MTTTSAGHEPLRSEEALIDMIAELRAAFLQAVPEAYNDHRFAEMMGSPHSVLEYVAKHLAAQQRWEPLPDGEYGGLEVSDNGREISLNTQDVHGISWDAIHLLPNDIRLFRRRQGGNDE